MSGVFALNVERVLRRTQVGESINLCVIIAIRFGQSVVEKLEIVELIKGNDPGLNLEARNVSDVVSSRNINVNWMWTILMETRRTMTLETSKLYVPTAID